MSKVFRNFFAAFRSSLSSGIKPKHVGSDQHGNKYFEKEADPDRNRRASRFIEERPDLADRFENPTIPVEWESWLRGKRDNPPTEEEIQRNYTRMMQTRMRAAELDKKFQKVENATDTNLPVENISQESFKSSFPVYDEFETKPGVKKS